MGTRLSCSTGTGKFPDRSGYKSPLFSGSLFPGPTANFPGSFPVMVSPGSTNIFSYSLKKSR